MINNFYLEYNFRKSNYQMKTIFKLIYQFLPFKSALFKGLKLIYSPKEEIYQHLHFIGEFKIKVSQNSSFKINHFGYQVENDIFWSGLYGNWEKDSLSIWVKLCKDAEVIFDIGANTGVYSLIAKSINKSNTVYAFDPVKRVYDRLIKNILLNEYDIKAFQLALSNQTGEAIVYDIDAEHTYAVTVNKNMHSPSSKVNEVKIKTLRLDQFIEQNNISKVDIMKIDVETHEPEVLEGMGVYLRRFRPTLLIEILNDDIASQIQELIKHIDYLYFNLNEKGDIKRVNNLKKSDYHNFLICDKKTALELNILF